MFLQGVEFPDAGQRSLINKISFTPTDGGDLCGHNWYIYRPHPKDGGR